MFVTNVFFIPFLALRAAPEPESAGSSSSSSSGSSSSSSSGSSSNSNSSLQVRLNCKEMLLTYFAEDGSNIDSMTIADRKGRGFNVWVKRVGEETCFAAH